MTKMPRRHASLTALGLLLLAAGFPAVDAAAKTKPGVAIEVVRLDGSEAAGELIAVRPGSLVIADIASAAFDFIPLAEIRIVRIPKVSKAAGAWSGFQQGAFYGAILGDLSAGREKSSRKRRLRALAGGLAGAAVGSLVGGLKGRTTKKKIVLQIADQPPSELAPILARLNALARIRETLQ
jgi:hypothetical protein